MDSDLDAPLSEPGVISFLNQALQESHKNKQAYYDMVINICMFLGTLLVMGLFLLYKYKGKLTPEEMAEQQRKSHRLILEKIRDCNLSVQRSRQALITGLPVYEHF